MSETQGGEPAGSDEASQLVAADNSVYVSHDGRFWSNGDAWNPLPLPPGATPINPWWDGQSWRWDPIPVGIPQSGANLRRIARIGVWFEVVIWGLVGVAMVATSSGSTNSVTTPDQLKIGGPITIAGALALAVVGGGWRRLSKMRPWFFFAHAVTAIGVAIVSPSLCILVLLCSIPAVVGLLYGDTVEERRLEMVTWAASAPVAVYAPKIPRITPALFGLVVGLTALGFVIGLLAAFDPNVSGTNPLPAGLLGALACGCASLVIALVISGKQSRPTPTQDSPL